MDHRYPQHQSRLDSSIDRKSVKPRNLTLLNKLSLKKSKDKSLSREPENHTKTANAIEILEAKEDSTVPSEKSESPASKNISLNNDSLQDFRSPEQNDEINKIDIECGFQLAGPTKKNVLLVQKPSKSGTKQKHCPREICRSENQLSIESSFFKPKMSKSAFVCPLCFKTFNEANTKNNHVKSCAAKNKISTKKLLDAVALQEKQTEERKAMGLLPAPAIQPKKHISRKMISDKDPQLQIGIALSMSLHEAQEAELMEQQYNLGLAETVDYNIKTLQNFGFVTSKPLDSSRAAKLKKKRITGPTLLQIRTQEERNRLITDRIAEILMGDEAITQAMLENAKEVIASRKKIIIKSKLLQSYHCTNNRLWDKSQMASNSKNLYFCDLLGISPCNTKDDTDIQTMQESKIDHVASVQYKCDSREPINENCYSPTKELGGEAENQSNAMHGGVKQTEHRNLMNNLSKDWAKLLNSSSMSDVIVLVKNDKHIYAHKLVFFVRCSNIMLDLDSNTDTKFHIINEKICWPNTDYQAALAFLEFIYCDVIDKHSCIFDDQALLTSVRILARKYQVKDLFSYLRDKQNELKFNEEKSINLRSSPTRLEFHDNDLIEYRHDGSCILQDDRTSIDRSDYIASEQPSSNNHVANEQTLSEIDVSLPNGNKESSSLHCDMIENASSSSNTLLADIDFSTMKTPSPKTAIQSDRIPTEQDETTEEFPEDQMTTETFPSSGTIYNCKATDKSSDAPSISYEQKRSISPDIFDESTLEYPMSFTKDSEQNQGDSNASTIDSSKMLDGNQNRSEIEVLHLCDAMDVHEAAISAEFETNLTQTLEKCSLKFSNVSTRRQKKKRKSLDDEKLTLNPGDECNISAEHSNIAEPLEKQKSDITLAIEKIQRLNAKSASDSDSDFEFPLTPLAKEHGLSRATAKSNTSFLFNRDANQKAPFKVVEEIQSKKRTALSMFEEKIKNGAAMNRTMFGLVSHNSRSNLECGESNESSKASNILTKKSDDDIIDLSQESVPKLVDPVDTVFDLTQESSDEFKADTNSEAEDDLSMFSKYKRKHSHNSIDEYRNALKRNLQSEASSYNRKRDENSSTNDFNHSAFRQEKSDDTELSPKSVEMNNHSELLTKSTESRVSDENVQFSAILDETELSDLEISLSNSSGIRYRNISTTVGNAIDKSHSNSMGNKRLSQRFIDKGEQAVENEEPVGSLIDISLSDTEFTILKNVNSENKNDHLSDQDTDVDYSSHHDNRDRTDDCNHQMNEKKQIHHNSPTKCLENKSKLNRNRSKRFSFDSDSRNKHMKPNSTNSQISIKPTTSRVCLSYDSDSDSIAIPLSRKIQGSVEPKHGNKQLVADSESSDEESYKLGRKRKSSPGSSSHELKQIQQHAKRLRGSSVSPKQSPKTSIRNLTAKSVSENLFTARSVERNRSSNNFNNDESLSQSSTPNRKRKMSDDSNKNTPQRNIYAKTTTLSGMYSSMRTPDLSRELDKYGLKKQSREKAKQLLRYIHKELHSSAPVDKSGQSGYNKSLRKGESVPNDMLNKAENQELKICGGTSSQKLRSNNTSTSKNVEIIDDLSSDESDSDDSITLSQTNTTGTLEEAFLKLLHNDRHLHNKILTYEPLHLENIHATLRAQGIKCSRKAMMNLLHDQCITFRTIMNEKRNRAKHKRSPSKH